MSDNTNFEFVEFLKKHKTGIMIAVLICFFAIQGIIIGGEYNKRSTLIGDEYLTLTYANYYKDGSIPYVNMIPEWQYGSWIDNSVFYDMVEIKGDDSILTLPVLQQLKRLIKGRTFFGFVNIVGSFSNNLVTYERNIILLNIFIIFLTEMLMYSLLIGLTDNRVYTLIGLILYGLCSGVVFIATYIRFYAWLQLLVIASIYIHYQMWTHSEWTWNILRQLLALILLFIGTNNSELMAILAVIIVSSYVLALLIAKNYKNLCAYSLVLITAGVAFVIKYSAIIHAILNPHEYVSKNSAVKVAGTSNRLVAAINGLISLTPAILVERIKTLCSLIRHNCFGARTTFYGILAVCIALIIYSILKSKTISKSKDKNNNSIFVLFILLIVVLYSLAVCVLDLFGTQRYVSPIFPLLPVVLTYYICNIGNKTRIRFGIMIVYFLLVTYGIVKGLVKAEYEYSYPTLRQDYAKIENVKECDYILVFSSLYHTAGYLYDSIYSMSPEARMYLTNNDEEYEVFDLENTTDTIVVWVEDRNADTKKLQNLVDQGYKVEQYARTSSCYVYLAEKQ